MTLFRIALGIVWIVLMVVSARALQQMGIDGANVFITDFSHPWRAQFYTDFSAHVILIALWMIYREPKLWVGIICAILAAFIGGAFSLAYILVATFRADGDSRKLLLGKHASAEICQ